MRRRTLSCLFLLLFGLGPGMALGQDPDLVLSLEGPGFCGDSFDVAVEFDNAGAGDVQGWSFGVCQSAAMVVSVVDGATTAVINNGGPPDFNQVSILPGGFTAAVVISFTGMAVLPPGTNYELNVATYEVTMPGDEVTLDFCDTLGSPPVLTGIVIGGQFFVPTQVGFACGTHPPKSGFDYIAPQETVPFDCTTGEAFLAASARIGENGFGTMSETQGFSMGLAHDPAFLAVVSLEPTGVIADLNGGAGPEFFGANLLSEGWTVGVVYSFTGMETIVFPPTPGEEVVEAEYQASGLPPMPTVVPLTWSNALGTPPVSNVVVVGGQSNGVFFFDGAIEFLPLADQAFIRGDCNDDGVVNIADGVFILNALFQGGPQPGCEAACDVNRDGLLDSSDAAYVFNYRFLDGPPPSAPFPDCGTEPGASCESYSSCTGGGCF